MAEVFKFLVTVRCGSVLFFASVVKSETVEKALAQTVTEMSRVLRDATTATIAVELMV